MSKFIKIYDGVIPISIQNHLEFLLTQTSGFKWCLLENMTGDEDSNNEIGFGFTIRTKKQLHCEESILTTNNYDALITPLYIFCTYQNLLITNIDTARTYLQLPSINPKPQHLHTDQDYPHYTFLYYVTDSDGDTIFYEDDKKTEIKRVSPKKGRIVLFNGLIPHSGSSPSKSKRAVININFHFKNLSNI